MVQNPKGVGQNKNTQLQDEKVAVITQAIKQLMTKNQKITIRKIQELSGVAKSTVEKHYKTITGLPFKWGLKSLSQLA